MSLHETPTRAYTKTQAYLGGLASSCGSALNSVMVVLGDRFGLYTTGQYRTDRADSRSVLSTPPTPPAAMRRRQPAKRRLVGTPSSRTP